MIVEAPRCRGASTSFYPSAPLPTYAAYGLVVSSELPFPELSEVSEDTPPDVDVVRGSVRWDGTGGDRRIAGQFEDLARFEISDGRRIVVEELRETDEDVIRARLLGEIFATLLRQRGLLVLHACAFVGRGGAVCIVGESGWGKSTLAEAFHQRGYALLTDDVAAIRVAESAAPVVIPSYPQIRLRDDSAAFLAPGGEGLEPISRNGPKLARAGVQMATDPVPVRATYFLEAGFRERTEIVDLPAQQALIQLVSHTRAHTLVHTNTPTLIKDHLRQCSDFVRAVEPRVLRRRYSFEALGEVMAAVEADAGVLPLAEGAPPAAPPS